MFLRSAMVVYPCDIHQVSRLLTGKKLQLKKDVPSVAMMTNLGFVLKTTEKNIVIPLLFLTFCESALYNLCSDIKFYTYQVLFCNICHSTMNLINLIHYYFGFGRITSFHDYFQFSVLAMTQIVGTATCSPTAQTVRKYFTYHLC